MIISIFNLISSQEWYLITKLTSKHFYVYQCCSNLLLIHCDNILTRLLRQNYWFFVSRFILEYYLWDFTEKYLRVITLLWKTIVWPGTKILSAENQPANICYISAVTRSPKIPSYYKHSVTVWWQALVMRPIGGGGAI